MGDKDLPWFQEYLPQEFKGFNLPLEIRQWRNRSIIALIIQACASLAGFSFYFIRKTTFVLIINTIALILTAIGFYGVLSLQKNLIAIHGVVTCAVLGATFVFSILEVAFGQFESKGNPNERVILFFFSFPYLIDFFSGLCTFYLTMIVAKMEEKNKAPELMDIPVPNNDDNQCIICLANQRDIVFYKCGHRVVCHVCAKLLHRNYNAICPICRSQIDDVIRQFD